MQILIIICVYSALLITLSSALHQKSSFNRPNKHQSLSHQRSVFHIQQQQSLSHQQPGFYQHQPVSHQHQPVSHQQSIFNQQPIFNQQQPVSHQHQPVFNQKSSLYHKPPNFSLSKWHSNIQLPRAQRFDRNFTSKSLKFIPLMNNIRRKDESLHHFYNSHKSNHSNPKTIALPLVQGASLTDKERTSYTDNSTDNVVIDMPFTVNFKCDILDKNICKKAHDSYNTAFSILSNLLILNRTIIIDASFSHFCQSNDAPIACDTNNLGFASTSSNWFLNETGCDPSVWYPQALAKQLSKNELDWYPSDITAKFNADKLTNGKSRFWFEGDGKIRKDQYDFTYVILHEVLHGLGILSYFGTYIDGVNAVVPLLELSNGRFNVNPPFLFDSLVYEKYGTKSLRDFYDEFKEHSNGTLSEYKESNAFKNARLLYRLSTESGLELRLPSITRNVKKGNSSSMEYRTEPILKINLHASEQPFKPATSISHLDQFTYDNTQDFLMRPTATAGKTLKSLTSKGKFPIGKVTIRLLSALGYVISSEPLMKYGNSVKELVGMSRILILAAVCMYLIN